MMNKQEIDNLIANNSIRQTNREWLESLSDEELANTLVYGYMRNEMFCDVDLSIGCNGETKQCVKCALAWLRAEHKE